MRICRVLLLGVAAASMLGCPVAPGLPDVKPGVINYQSDPVTQGKFYIYLPKGYTHAKAWPVIITCHGTIPYDTAERHIQSLDDYGEKYGCIVIAPELEGTDGIFGDGPVSAMLNDERNILSILSRLSYQFNIDRANIMITGFSGGGFPAYWVGLRNPDVFSVIVAQNCNFNTPNTDGWYPSEAKGTPIMIYWGQNDPGTIVSQSQAAVAYLRSKGFRVTTKILPGVGHDRHPEVAVRFFQQHWKAAQPSQPAVGMYTPPARRRADPRTDWMNPPRDVDAVRPAVDIDALPRGPRPPAP